MIDAWGNADGAALEALLRDARDEKTRPSALTQCTLTDSDKPAFIAVGLLHLLGRTWVTEVIAATRGVYGAEVVLTGEDASVQRGFRGAPSHL